MSVLDALTKNLVETSYDALAVDVVEATKKQVLDMLGVIVAGSTCNTTDEMNGLVSLIKEWGGKEESTIIAFGGRVPAPNTTFVNGIFCMRRDFDDTHLKYGSVDYGADTGNSMTKVAPLPNSLSAYIRPPCSLTIP